MTTTTQQKYAVYFDDSEDSQQMGVFADKVDANKAFTEAVDTLKKEIEDGEWDELYEKIDDYPDIELAIVDEYEDYKDTVMFWCHSKGYQTPKRMN